MKKILIYIGTNLLLAEPREEFWSKWNFLKLKEIAGKIDAGTIA